MSSWYCPNSCTSDYSYDRYDHDDCYTTTCATRNCPRPAPCPTSCCRPKCAPCCPCCPSYNPIPIVPPSPGPVIPAPGITQYLEAFTTGTSSLNTLSVAQLTRPLTFTTLGLSQGTAISYSATSPQTITLNAPGRYLVIFKGTLNFNVPATTGSTGTVTTTLQQGTTPQDQVVIPYSSTTTQAPITLQAIVCNASTPTTLNVTGTATGLAGTSTITYDNVTIIIIQLSTLPC